jgi:hypothetical protein
MAEALQLRTGRKVGRTLYQVHPDGTERLIGLIDTPELARQVTAAVNGASSDVDAECRAWIRRKLAEYVAECKQQLDTGGLTGAATTHT